MAVPLAAQTASAQMPQVLDDAAGKGGSTAAEEASALPEPLTRQAIRDVLSGLSDAQARELLLHELDGKVTPREAELAAAEERGLGALLGEWALALGQGWVAAVRDTATIPGAAAATFESFESRRGDASLWRIGGTLLLCLLAGVAAAVGARRLTIRPEGRLDDRPATSLWSQIGIITGRFLIQGVRLFAFVVADFVVDAMVNRTIPADSTVVRYLVGSVGWTWFAIMAARFVLSPTRPRLRLCTVDDRTAWFLTRRIGLIFGWSAFAAGFFFS